MTEHAPSFTSAAAAPSGVSKKKFAAPPVKSACLACRAARTRCDGDKPCATCQARSRECIYTPSRRGGPRCRKKPLVTRDTADEPRQIPDDVFVMLSQEPTDIPRNPISVQEYIAPGAGLKQLEDWVQDSDFIFDSLFMNSTGYVGDNGFSPGISGTGTPSIAIPMVRSYQSEAAILDAYYIYIHPFLPILPPPSAVPLDQPVPRLQNQIDVFEEGFEPMSPISLAISAILALVPCPTDADYQSHESLLFRRKYAQYFAQSAFDTIENDEEIPDSAIEPQKALSEEHNHTFRQPFHPRVPAELESIIALDILSVYEYAQRGNIKKMQNRAGQALMSAMDKGLHSCTTNDEFSEARRRVWWMTYVCVAQGTIVSNTKPSFAVYSPSYKAKFPTFTTDPEAFSVYIEAQRAILATTQFVIELNKSVKENGDMKPIFQRMKELEAYLEPLLSRSESWILSSTTTSPIDPTEGVVTRSLRCMARIKSNSARIKLHRYCAFFDTPVFARKHCDLKSTASTDNGDEPRKWPTCSCGTFANPFANSVGAGIMNQTTSSPSNTNTSAPSPSSDGTGGGGGGGTLASGPTSTSTPSTSVCGSVGGTDANNSNDSNDNNNIMKVKPAGTGSTFPFSSHQSAKICLKSALAIAHSFDDLPFPNPTGVAQPRGPPVFLSPTSTIVCPRTMPSFACCAMQCAYALLMVYQKTKSMYPYPYPYPFPSPFPSTADESTLKLNAAMSTGTGTGTGTGVGGGPTGPVVGLVPQAEMGTAQMQWAQRPMVVNSLLDRLQQGLTSIFATLANYATAFEALGGMRDQIRSAVEESAAFVV